MDIAVRESRFDLVPFIFAHQAVINKNTGKLLAHGTGKQRGCDRAVNAARKCKQYLAAADFMTERINSCPRIIAHGPVAHSAAHFIKKVTQHRNTIFRMKHLGVHLKTI